MTVPVPKIVAAFCDDVRRETGGKLSLMGVYRHAIGFSGPSLLMPKFVAIAFMDIPLPVRERTIDIWVSNEDSPVTPPISLPLDEAEAPPSWFPSLPHLAITVPIELCAFELRDGMSLHINVQYGDYHWKSEPLRAFSAPAAASETSTH